MTVSLGTLSILTEASGFSLTQQSGRVASGGYVSKSETGRGPKLSKYSLLSRSKAKLAIRQGLLGLKSGRSLAGAKPRLDLDVDGVDES